MGVEFANGTSTGALASPLTRKAALRAHRDDSNDGHLGTAMSKQQREAEPAREPLLSPVDRVSELHFGLFMALSFVGAVSVGQAGQDDIRKMLAAALGCNLAWGLVDAVMYLVRTVTDRGRSLALVRSAADVETGRTLIDSSLSRIAAGLVTRTEVEAIRGQIVARASVPARPTLRGSDLLAAVGIFLILTASTFPVVLPFMLFEEVGMAKAASQAMALTMLFFGGLALGRFAGYGSWRAGLLMAGLGTVLVPAIRALGG